MALDDKTLFRVFRNSGLTRQVAQALIDRFAQVEDPLLFPTVMVLTGTSEPDNAAMSIPLPSFSTTQMSVPLCTLAPGGGLGPVLIYAPIPLTGYISFYVYSYDGAQIIEQRWQSQVSTVEVGNIPYTVPCTNSGGQKGSDLSYDTGTNKIVSAAGGIFGAHLEVQLQPA